jgi:hypothetical protein
MRLFTFLLCVFAFTALSAQGISVDTDGPVLAYKTETTTKTSSFKIKGRERTLLGDLDLSGAWGGPTYNYSSTGDDWALMRGGFGGLEFSEELFIGYGGWKSREAFTLDEAEVSGTPEYDFNHSGLIIAYSPFADNAIHPRITTIFGPGRFELNEEPATGARDDRFLVGQATIGLELNLFQWFRLGIDGGYRFASGIDNDVVTAKDVGGAIIQAEARFGFSW